MGTFIVGAFVISTFFVSFEKEFRVELLKKKQRSRSGLFAGYAIMDFGHQGAIHPDVLSVFYKIVTAETNEPDELKRKRAKDFVQKARTLEGFIEGLELHFDEIHSIQSMEKLGHFDKDVLQRKLAQKYQKELQTGNLPSNRRASVKFNIASQMRLLEFSTKASGTFRRRLFVFMARPLFSHMVTVMVMFQCGLSAFYGYVPDNYLDTANIILCFLFFIEIMLKLYAYGWDAVFLFFVVILFYFFLPPVSS